MLGNTVLRFFAQHRKYEVFGSVRTVDAARKLSDDLTPNIVTGVDVENSDSLTRAFAIARPDVVINCVGVVKQLAAADNPLEAIPINSLLPHRLAQLCQIANARLVHMSTDCVFSGAKGMYVEDDVSDAQDLYGRSKFLGEVDYSCAVTLRTSIIGHELGGRARSLLGWFLSQSTEVKGFARAIFSGLPTVEIANIIHNYVIPNPELRGLYHVSSEPISKFDLLTLIAKTYGKVIDIKRDEEIVIDRSLNSLRFRQAAGYSPPSWSDLIRMMRDFG